MLLLCPAQACLNEAMRKWPPVTQIVALVRVWASKGSLLAAELCPHPLPSLPPTGACPAALRCCRAPAPPAAAWARAAATAASPRPQTREACSEGVAVGGHAIPKGARLGLDVWAVHRNPRYYPDPEEYRRGGAGS